MSMSRIEHAIEYAKRGYYVFPVRRDKTPYTQNGFHDARNIPGTVEPLFCDYHDVNVAISTGPSGLFVLDVDNKADKNGYAALQALIDEYGPLPETVTATTPSGGKHYYFRGTGPTTTGTIGVGLDTRGEGGYVVAPPSRGTNGAYTWDGPGLDTMEPAEAPQWLVDLAYESNRSAPTTVTNAEGESVIPNGQRNSTLTSIGGVLRNCGFGEVVIHATLSGINETACETPLPDQEVRTVANSVARYEAGVMLPPDSDEDLKGVVATLQKNPYACTSPAVLETLHRLGRSKASRLAINGAVRKVISTQDLWDAVQQYADEQQGDSPMMTLREQLANKVDLTWLIEDLIVREGLSIVAAPPKSGKSCFIRWLLYCVASGIPFFDRPVNAGSVIYYAAEEPKAVVDNEFDKIITKFGYPTVHEIHITIGALRASKFVERLTNDIRRTGAVLVVIDPLFDAITVDDEKSYPQVRSALQELRRVALTEHVHIMVAHHTRKAASERGSAGDILGSQALRGATEHNFRIVGEQKQPRKLFVEQRCGDALYDELLIYSPETGEVRLGTKEDREVARDENLQSKRMMVLADIITVLEQAKRDGVKLNQTQTVSTDCGSDRNQKGGYRVWTGNRRTHKGERRPKLLLRESGRFNDGLTTTTPYKK